jgi:hypothetical protein
MDGKPMKSGKAFPSNRDTFAERMELIFLKRGEKSG